MTRILAIVLLLSAAFVAQAQSSSDVRIYRCTDATGKQALRDTPCPKGQTQQTRDMLRPKDAPKTAKPMPAPAPTPSPAQPPAQAVYLAPPKPMYECVTDEGKRYTSDNGEGNPRWVPFWTLGYPVYGGFRRGDAEMLHRVFDNLLRNALAYASGGGWIGLRLEARAETIEVCVEDRGPGVLSTDLGRLFDPFFRGSQAPVKKGHGLGLAIARQIVANHGGGIHAENRREGGLRVCVRLPRATAGSPAGAVRAPD